MPIGRHWKQLRAYDDCFVASEAVDWLYEFLQQHHEAGAELTRYVCMVVSKIIHAFVSLCYYVYSTIASDQKYERHVLTICLSAVLTCSDYDHSFTILSFALL